MKTAEQHFADGAKHYNEGNYENALKGYSNAVEVNPFHAEAHLYKGYSHYQLQDLKGAIASFGTVLAINAHHAEAEHFQAQAAREYLQAADKNKAEGRGEQALEQYEFIAEHRPNALTLNNHNDMGISHFALGNFEQAIVCYDRGIALEENQYRYIFYQNKGHSQEKLGRDEDAIASFQQAVHINPNFAGAHSDLERMASKPENAVQILDIYTQLLELHPENEQVNISRNAIVTGLTRKADRLKDEGKYDDALAVYAVIAPHKPDDLALHSNIGIAHYSKGDYKAAIASYDYNINRAEALGLNPKSAYVHYIQRNKGHSLQKLGRDDEAIASFQAALTIDSGYRDAQMDLNAATARKSSAAVEGLAGSVEKMTLGTHVGQVNQQDKMENKLQEIRK